MNPSLSVLWVLGAFLPSARAFSAHSVRSGRVFTARPNHGRPLFLSSESAPCSNEDQTDSRNFVTELMAKVQTADINSIINNGLVVAVCVGVLMKLSLVNEGMTRGWTVSEMVTRIPMDLWASYHDALTSSPIETKAATSATVYTIGDVIAQRTEGSSMGELDRGRIVRSMVAGAIGHGPLSHFWYNYSEGFFNDYLHWTEWWSFFPKVILDQATWGPFWNNVYIVLLGVMKWESVETMWSDIKRTTVPLVVSGLKLWPLAHCVTYGLVPVESRLLWVDVVEIVWVTILATQAAKVVPTDELLSAEGAFAANEKVDAEMNLPFVETES